MVTGGTPPSGNPDLYSGQVPFVTPGDLGNRRNIHTAERTLSEAGLGYARPVPTGSTLVTCIGSTIGKLGFATVPVATNQQINAVVPHSEHDPDFIYYQLERLGPSFKILAGTQAVPLLNKSAFSEVQLIVPATRREESRIAEALITWDAAIATSETLLINNRTQKRALVQRLLSERINTWKSVTLAEIAERIQRPSDGEVHPILMISSGSGFVRQDQKYSRFMAGKSLNDYVLLKRGEFAYNKGNSKLYEFGCVFPLADFETGLVPHVYVCFDLNAERCHSSFFKYLFEADYLHDQLGALVNTGVRNNGLLNIRPSDFMNVTVPVPPLDEQQRIAEILNVASREIEMLTANVKALRQEKRALMQDLLTGKRRVKLPSTDTVATPP